MVRKSDLEEAAAEELPLEALDTKLIEQSLTSENLQASPLM